MQLNVEARGEDRVRAGYECPCGCTPSVEYERGQALAHEACCCGNEFAVGPGAAGSLTPRPGFRSEQTSFAAGWGGTLEAAWLVGPSVHGPAADDASDRYAGANGGDESSRVIDPVCGMTVEPESATSKNLQSSREGHDYFFCGKGCKLEFDDDPGRFLDPAYVPSM